jgi:hypothetical protein
MNHLYVIRLCIIHQKKHETITNINKMFVFTHVCVLMLISKYKNSWVSSTYIIRKKASTIKEWLFHLLLNV